MNIMSVEDSIVKIISSVAEREYSTPWITASKGRAVGTGFCINASKKSVQLRILTNAHVVENATKIILIKQGSSIHYNAKVSSVIYECDLALLELETNDPEFWKTTPPLELAPLPPKSSKVRCYGYPLGGDNISITKGVISRVEILPYMRITNGIAIQIDAAINPGNSGGPALNTQGKVVGVAFSGIDAEGIQNMGYIIPPILVRYYLRYIDKYGTFNGLSFLGVDTQNLQNEVLRKYCGLNPSHTGVLVSGVTDGSSAFDIIRPGDVITKINGIDVDYDGTIKLSQMIHDFNRSKFSRGPTVEVPIDSPEYVISGEVVHFDNMVGLKIPGEEIKISIIRNKKDKILKVILRERDFLVPISTYQLDPVYYIVAGLVFVPLSRMFIIEKMDGNTNINHLIGLYGGGHPKKKGDQIIILSEVLSAGLTYGYDTYNNVLHSINGTEIHNMNGLRDMVNAILNSDAKFMTFEYKDSSDVHVFSTSDVKKYSKKIIHENIGKIPITNL